MMATGTEILLEAAGVFLNDTPRTLFTDAILLPFLKRSFLDLQLEMDKKGVSALKEVSTPITVNALVVVLASGGQLPADFVSPIKMEERTSGSSDIYQPMLEKEWEANILQTDRLRYWTYREDEIKFPGATVARQVLLYYLKGLTVGALGSPIGIQRVESYLSAQTAGYAAKFIMQSDTRADACFGIASKALADYFSTQVRAQQYQDIRRHRYLSRFRRRSNR